MTVTAAADSGRWLQTLAFDGREVMAASGAAATVGDDDDNIRWERAMWRVLTYSLALFNYQIVDLHMKLHFFPHHQ